MNKNFLDGIFRFNVKIAAADPAIKVITGDKDRIVGVTSKYTPASCKQATIMTPLAEAMLKMLDPQNIAVARTAETDDALVVEAILDDEPSIADGKSVPIVAFSYFNKETNKLLAMKYENKEDYLNKIPYDLSAENFPAYVVHLALWDKYCEDAEFESAWRFIKTEYNRDRCASKADQVRERCFIACDNVYRRLKSGDIEIDSDVPCDVFDNVGLMGKTFTPKYILAGEFKVLGLAEDAERVDVEESSLDNAEKNALYNGKYALEAVLTEQERENLPKIPPNIVVPRMLETVAKMVYHAGFRNILFHGPAGSGKSLLAFMLACMLGLPYGAMAMSAHMDLLELLGQLGPADKLTTDGAISSALIKKFNDLGGVTLSSVCEVLSLPTKADIDEDPTAVYRVVTGTMGHPKSKEEVVSLWADLVLSKANEVVAAMTESNGPQFRYMDTQFAHMIEFGGVFEIQEPNVLQPAVLVGLNQLLAEGCITLPNGRVVKRHPNFIIVFTTNTTYEGCRQMNQSLIDRMDIVKNIPAPDLDTVCNRAMVKTGFEDRTVAREMATVITDIVETMERTGVEDGACGPRSLIAWMKAVKMGMTPYDAFFWTVLDKTSFDPDARKVFEERLNNSSFRPARRKRGR